MKYIRERVRSGEFLSGVWCGLGSSIIAEIAGRAGFDWVLIDLEHGSGDFSSLLNQLQAIEATAATPIVRIDWNEQPKFKRVLDMGTSGVMVPFINSESEAKDAVASMRYPPDGTRGVAAFNRASGFSAQFDEYFKTANDNLLTIAQIESATAIANINGIASTDGIDVLFVGPLDLSTNLGVQKQFNSPLFQNALHAVADAAKQNGKAAGILLADDSLVPMVAEIGYTFVALGSDGGMLSKSMKITADFLNSQKK